LVWTLVLAGRGDASGAVPADAWMDEPFRSPAGTAAPTSTPAAETLSARADGSRLVVAWGSTGTNEVSATVWFSPERPGHWTARDWSRRSAEIRGGEWSAVLPVVDLDEPILYFAATVTTEGTTNVSRARLCWPREIPLPQPTAPRIWFLEGFEEGRWNWRSTDERAVVRRMEGGRQSGHALALEMPAGQRAASVATSRIRGGARAVGATGFSLWMRSSATNGLVRLVAVADAGTERQVTAVFPTEVAAGSEWSRRVFRFDELRGFPVGALDRVVVEFSATGPATLWLDDLELIDF
jgi:hypothetical protein